MLLAITRSVAVRGSPGRTRRTVAAVRDEAVRVPEAARRLGLDGVEVYRLIETGQLAAGKGPDGLVYVRTEAIDAYVGGA